MALTPGTRLGVYEVVASIGKGGMGLVFRARDTKLDRDVAIKILPEAFAHDADRLARFQREAKTLASLNHPNIAAIYGLEESGGVTALVMELVEGDDLSQRIARGAMPLDEALPNAMQIAEALEAAHEQGVIHRDLKPANIKVRPDGTVKVLDFGLAKALLPVTPDPAAAALSPTITTPAMTQAGIVLGTAAYMSPEQARGQVADKRSDVWAFGCVLFEMLTGKRAFAGDGVSDTIAAVLRGEPDWAALPARAPARIRTLLRRCLEKDRKRRLRDIGDAAIEIQDVSEEREAKVPSGDKSTRRERMLVISTALLTCALAAAFGAWFLRPPAPVPELRVAEITTPRTSDPWSFAISPDGRRLAFVADSDGQSTLWVRHLDAARVEALPGTEGARRPFWSPDSRSVAFFASNGLKRIEARGSSVQTVTTAIGGITGAWGPDGNILFSSTAAPSLLRVNAAGGTAEPATKLTAGSTGHGHPQFLPGGRQFLFFVGGTDTVRGVYLGSLDSFEVTRVLASDTQGAYVAPGWLLFARQGALLAHRFDVGRRTLSGEPITVADSVAVDSITGAGAFSTSDSGVMAYRTARPALTELLWFDRSGNALGTFGSPEQAGLSTFTLSPDGRRVAAERTVQNETDVWLLDSTRPTRFTRAARGSVTRVPVWSRDGRRVAFESAGPGSVKLAAKPPGGGEEDVLFESPQLKVPSDWSTDGRFLLYYTPDPKSGTDLWVWPRDTGVPVVFLKTEANELWGQFSPDGRWVAYQSNETGAFEIYVRPFSGPGEPFPISTGGGVYPRWSRDGKELYYIAPDAKIMAVPIRAPATMFDAGVPAPLFQTRRVGGGLNLTGRGHQYDVTDDGRFLINVDADSNAPPITLMLNWKP